MNIDLSRFKLNWRTLIKVSLLPSIISLIIFFTNYKFFGLPNVIIAPYMTLTFIRMKGYLTIEKNPIKPLFIHLIIGVVATIASLGWIHSLIIDFVATIILTYLLTDEYNPSSYFPYLMAFVFLQLFPAGYNEIPIRLLAIVYSYVIIFIALKIFAPKMVTSKIRLLIREGYTNIAKQTELLSKGNFSEVEDFQFKLFDICKELNRLIYSGGKNKYYPFIIFFQHINNILGDLYDLRYITNSNKDYLKNLSNLFSNIHNLCENNKQDLISDEVLNFLNNNKFEDKDLNHYFTFILDYLVKGSIKVYNEKDSIIKTYFDFRENKEYFKNLNKYKFSLNEFKLRFSLRMGILLSVTFSFVRWSGLEKSYWIPMTVFLLTLPFYEDSKKRVKERFFGTLIGIVLASILFSIFRTHELHMLILIVSTFLMYSFIADYGIMTIYITCYALAISTLTIGSTEAILLRILYTIAALLIVLFANRFIFRTKNYIELKNMIDRLIVLDEEMIKEFKNILNNDINREKLQLLVYSSYLVSGKLQMHNNPKSTAIEDTKIRSFIFNNNRFTTLLSHLCVILYDTKKKIDVEYINECIHILEDIISNMKNLNNSSEINQNKVCKNISIINHQKDYFNIQMINCLSKAKESSDSLEDLMKTI